MTQDQKHILLTTDFSEESFEAFAPVADLAKAMNAKVTLLYVLPTMDHHPTGSPFVSPVPMPSDAEQMERAEKDLEKLRGRFDPGVDLHVACKSGEEIPEVILDYVKQNAVDVIARATHAEEQLQRRIYEAFDGRYFSGRAVS